jgi:hypothetical protein
MDLTATVVAFVGLTGIVFSILGDEVQRDWMRLLGGTHGSIDARGWYLLFSLPLSGTPSLGIGCFSAGGRMQWAPKMLP